MTPVTIDPLYVPPAASEDTSCVISLSDLEDYLGEDLSTNDAAPLVVEAGCAVVRTVAEQHFNLIEDETIVLDGTGTDALLLPERPVNEVSAVLVNDEAATDYVLNDNGVLLRDSPGVWRAGRQNISVTYSHGYATADMPADVVAVALSVAKRLLYSASSAAAAASSGVEMETLGAYTVRYATSSSSSSSSNGDDSLLTAGEKAILRRYKQSK